jgi:hypothetical protein
MKSPIWHCVSPPYTPPYGPPPIHEPKKINDEHLELELPLPWDRVANFKDIP